MSRRSPTMSGGPRWDDIIKSSRSSRRRPLRTGRARRGGFYALMVLAILGLFGAAAFAYVQLKLKGNTTDIAALNDQKPNTPMNVLVLGSDSRAVLPDEEQGQFDPTGKDRGTGRRADTIILIHLDEQREKAVLVHFPRDLRVRYPDGKTGKINGAYQKGPEAMVKTVQNFTGLEVHHFVEVNFVGFRNIVDALGGVDVYFERAIKDPDSGLNVPKGCVRLTGNQALAFVRVRKIDNDFGRIARQQLFVSLMMDKVTSAKTLFNPVKIFKLVDLFSDNVTTNVDFSVRDMASLGSRLRTFDTKRVDMRVIPSSGRNLSGVSY
ncbi:MAG: LCP family protein, partial [Acidimicrobiia bacterium]